MLSRLDQLWRIGGTGVAFASFSLGGGILAVTVFPLLSLLTPGTKNAHRRVRLVIHHAFRLFVWYVKKMGIIDVTVEDGNRLSDCRGCLIVANHPTLLDVVLLMSLTPNVQCVVKYQLWRNLFLRGVVSAAGFIRNDLPAEEFLEQCADTFSRGDNLLIFPEGTRTVPGGFPIFQRGFANIAVLSRAALQLVIITCEPITLTRGTPWYSVPRSRPRFRIRVDERWGEASYQTAPHRALKARNLVRNLETYYRSALSDVRAGA